MVQLGAVVALEPNDPSRPVNAKPIPAWTEVIGDGECRECPKGVAVDVEEQAQLPSHAVEDNVGPQQVHPRRGREQLVPPDRPALDGPGLGCLDPNSGLRDEARRQQAGAGGADGGTQRREGDDPPAVSHHR